MPTQQLIKIPFLINQYPIVTPKSVINNNDASRIKKLNVVPLSAIQESIFILEGNFFECYFLFLKIENN